MIQHFFFVPLDIFSRTYKNIGIQNKTDAWLTFISQDSPEAVIDLVEKYPQFRDYYNHVYDICRNIEDIMGLFSEELLIMDRNTVKIMVEEMSEEIKKLKEDNSTIKQDLAEKDQALVEKDQALAEKDQALAEKDLALAEKDQALAESEEKNAALLAEIKRLRCAAAQ